MVVVSLFDGMSCGQIALNKIGKKPTKYFASEIKKHAIQVTQHNYPDTIQIGDITKVSFKGGVLYTSNGNFEVGRVDLLIGGSPCQDFSAQNKQRKGLAGLKSNLFFEYLRLLHEINPTYHLLENVIMLPKHFATLSNYMQSYPFETCGSLVSAAYRRRLFWTNIGDYYLDLFGFSHCDLPQPKDKGIQLQEILTDGYTDLSKAYCLKVSNGGSINGNYEHDFNLVVKRYYKAFDNFVFNSNDFNVKKGVRFFNQTELERLHNIPEGYTSILNVKKAHDLIGDGWTVDIAAHIFSFIK